MESRRTSTARVALLPLAVLLVLFLSALCLTLLIGDRGAPGLAGYADWGEIPGMGASILPRWTLGNFDPRLEGAARGEERPIPASVSCAPDRAATLTRFDRLPAGPGLPRLRPTRPEEGTR